MRRRWIGLVLAAAMVAGGCRSSTASAGPKREQSARYRFRTLSSDLPANVRVPSIAAAAEAALRQRGYSVTRSTTEDYARIEGEGPQSGWLEKVVVRARQTSSKTKVEIIAQPLGDQVLCRSILDDMLSSLGM